MLLLLEYNMDIKWGKCRFLSLSDELSKAFPFHCTELAHYTVGERFFTKRDGLSWYMLILTVDGCGKMQYMGKSCLLDKGSAVLINCRNYQEYSTLPGQIWNHYYIHFEADSLSGYENMLLNTLTTVRLRSEKYCHDRIEQLLNMPNQTDLQARAMQSNVISDILTEMICSLVEMDTDTTVKQRKNIQKLAEYIQEHCTESLHMEDLAALTKWNKSYLIRVFGQQIGVSPYKYMHLCRISRAQILLRTTKMNVTEIAEQVGYSDSVIFIRHFKAFNGMTPGEYRDLSFVLP